MNINSDNTQPFYYFILTLTYINKIKFISINLEYNKDLLKWDFKFFLSRKNLLKSHFNNIKSKEKTITFEYQ